MDCDGGRKMNIWEEGFLATNNTKCLPWELSTCKTLWALWCSVSKYKACSNSREKNSLSLSLLFLFQYCVSEKEGVYIYIYILFFCIEFSFFSIVVTRRQRWNSSFLILSRSIELDKDWEGVEVEHGKSLCCSCN